MADVQDAADEPEDLFVDEDDCMDIDMDDIRLLDDIDDAGKSPALNASDGGGGDGLFSPKSVDSSSVSLAMDSAPSIKMEPVSTVTLFSENLEESIVIKANKASTGDIRVHDAFSISHQQILKELPSGSVQPVENNAVGQPETNSTNQGGPLSDIHDIKLRAPKRKNVRSPLKTIHSIKKEDNTPLLKKIKLEPSESGMENYEENTEVAGNHLSMQSVQNDRQETLPVSRVQQVHNSSSVIGKDVPQYRHGLVPVALPELKPKPTSQASQIGIPGQIPVIQPGQIPDIQSVQIPISAVQQGHVVASAVQAVAPASNIRQISTFQPGQIPAVQPGQIPAVQPGQIPAVQSGQIPSVQPGQIPAVQPGQIPTIHPGQIPTFQTGQIPASVLHPGQVIASAIQPGQIPTSVVQPGQILGSPVQPGHLSLARPFHPGQLTNLSNLSAALQPGQVPVSTHQLGQTGVVIMDPAQLSIPNVQQQPLQISGIQSLQLPTTNNIKLASNSHSGPPPSNLSIIVNPGLTPLSATYCGTIKPAAQQGQKVNPVPEVQPSPTMTNTPQQGLVQMPSMKEQNPKVIRTSVDTQNRASDQRQIDIPTTQSKNTLNVQASEKLTRIAKQVSKLPPRRVQSSKTDKTIDKVVQQTPELEAGKDDSERSGEYVETEHPKKSLSNTKSVSSNSSLKPSASKVGKPVPSKVNDVSQTSKVSMPTVVLQKLDDKVIERFMSSSAKNALRHKISSSVNSKPAVTSAPSNVKITSEAHVSSADKGSASSDNCYLCKMEFCSKTDMLYHIQISHSYYTNKGLCSCTHCGKSHKSLEEVVEHEKKDHSLSLSCCFCGKQQLNDSTLQTHVCNHIQPLTYLCMLCREDFSSVQLAEKHITMHKSEVAFWTDFLKCRFCGSLFSKRHKLYHHIHTAHASLFMHKCKACSQHFYTEHALLLHRSDKNHFLDGKKMNLKENIELHFDMSSEKVSEEMIDITDDGSDESTLERIALNKNEKEVIVQPAASESKVQTTNTATQRPVLITKIKEQQEQLTVKSEMQNSTSEQKGDISVQNIEFCFYNLLKISTGARDNLLQQSVSFVGEIDNGSHTLLTKMYKQKFHVVTYLKSEIDSVMELVKKNCMKKNAKSIPSYAKSERIFVKEFLLIQKSITFQDHEDNARELVKIIREFYCNLAEVLKSPHMKVVIEKEHNKIAIDHYKEWMGFATQLVTGQWDCVRGLAIGALKQDKVGFLKCVIDVWEKKVAVTDFMASQVPVDVQTPGKLSETKSNCDLAESKREETSSSSSSKKADKTVQNGPLEDKTHLGTTLDGKSNSKMAVTSSSVKSVNSPGSSLSSVLREAQKRNVEVSKLNKVMQSDSKLSLAYISKEYLNNAPSVRESLQKQNFISSSTGPGRPSTTKETGSVKQKGTESQNAETIDLTDSDKNETANVDEDEEVDVEDDVGDDAGGDDDDDDAGAGGGVGGGGDIQQNKPQSEAAAESLLMECEEDSSETRTEQSPIKTNRSSEKVIVTTSTSVDSHMILDCQSVKVEPDIDGYNVDLTLVEDDEDVKETSSNEEDKSTEEQEKGGNRDSFDNRSMVRDMEVENGKIAEENDQVKLKAIIKVENTDDNDVYQITLADDFNKQHTEPPGGVQIKQEIPDHVTIKTEQTDFTTEQLPERKLKLVQVFSGDMGGLPQEEMS